MARRTKLTAPLTDAIVQAIEKFGLPVTTAGEAFGVSADTVREWLRRGEDRDDRENGEPYAAFAARIRAAEASRMGVLIGPIEDAALGGDWRAAAWMLERRFPETWGARRQPAQTPAASISIEAVLQIFAQVVALNAPEPGQFIDQVAQGLGISDAGSDKLRQALTVPVPVPPASD